MDALVGHRTCDSPVAGAIPGFLEAAYTCEPLSASSIIL